MKRDKQRAIAITAILLLSLGMLVTPACTAGNLVSHPERGSHVASHQTHHPLSGLNSPQQPSETGVPLQGSNQLGNQVGLVDHAWESWWGGAYPMPDVTCDNKTDVLVNIPQWSEDGGRLTWRVIAKNGKTGSHLWEESATGEFGALEMKALGVLDCDWWWYWYNYELWYGDQYSWDWNWYWDWYWNWDGGAYGDWYKNTKYAPGMADMNGDGKGDVLVTIWRYEENYTATLIAKNGTTGEHLWEEPIGGNESEEVDLWAYGFPDVSGDGNVDVLVWVGYYDWALDEERERIIVKNGTTGEHLWEEENSTADTDGDYIDLEGYAVPDLSGDGKPDVLVWLGEEASEARVTLIAKNGTTGEHLWEERNSTKSTDWNSIDMWFDPVPDLSCDGKTDVLVQLHEYNNDERNETVIVKNGTDGTHLWEETFSLWVENESTGYAYYGMWAEPVPDLNCDNKTDVLVFLFEYNETEDEETLRGTVIAKNGTTGEDLWDENITRTYDDDWNYDIDIWAEAAPDLSCDGKADVLVFLYEYYYESEVGGEEKCTLIAKNGTDGTHLWEENITSSDSYIWVWLDAYGYPDMNGDGKADVLVHLWEYNDDADEETNTIIAKNGTTGDHLWEEYINLTDVGHSDGDYESWVYPYAVPDMSCDNLTDVAVVVYEYDYYHDYYDYDVKNFTIIVKNGTNGTHLWEENVTGEDLYYAEGGVVPDLECDGKPDVLVWYFEYNDSTETVTTTTIAKKGTNGTHLWEEAVSSTLTEEGTGVTFEPETGTFCEPCTAVARSELPAGAEPLPSGVVFPYGFFSFSICGLEPNATVNVTITLPGPVPVGTLYWKFSPDGSGAPGGQPGWFSLPIGDDDGDNVIIVTVQDGGIGDLDGVANGEIHDPGAPGIRAGQAEQLPALMPLGIAALVGVLAILATSAIVSMRKRR